MVVAASAEGIALGVIVLVVLIVASLKGKLRSGAGGSERL
jgi:hypothetical protein